MSESNRASSSYVGNIPRFDFSFETGSETSDIRGTPSVESIFNFTDVIPAFIESPFLNQRRRTTPVHVFDFRKPVAPLELLQASRIVLEDDLMDTNSLSGKLNVLPEYVIVSSDSTKKIAVIVDRLYTKRNLFLLINCYHDNYPRILYCVCVDEHITVSQLIYAISEKQAQKDQGKVCLLVQGRIVHSSAEKVINLGLNNLVECKPINQRPITLKCRYHVTPKVEFLYYLECTSTDSVREVKDKIYSQLGKEFPNILHQGDEIVISCDTGILEDNGYLFPSDEVSLSQIDVFRRVPETITIQTKRGDSIPIVAVYNGLRTTIVIQRNISTEYLRYKIGKHIKKHPQALKLKINNTKVPDINNLAKLDSFTSNCEIQVVFSKKTTFQMIFANDSTDSRIVDMYKNDKVCQLKDIIASSIGARPFDLQLCHSGTQMDDNKRLKEYYIRSDGIIEVVVLENRIKLMIRCCWYPPLIIAIDNSRNTTVLQLKTFLSTILNLRVFKMNIVFKGTSLRNCATVSESGIRCYNTLVVCMFSHSERNNDKGIFRRISLDGEGTVHLDEAVIMMDGDVLGFREFKDLDTLPGYCHQNDERQGSHRGIRLLDDDQKGDAFKLYRQQRQNTVRSSQSGHVTWHDTTHSTEGSSTSSVICTERTTYQEATHCAENRTSTTAISPSSVTRESQASLGSQSLVKSESQSLVKTESETGLTTKPQTVFTTEHQSVVPTESRSLTRYQNADQFHANEIKSMTVKDGFYNFTFQGRYSTAAVEKLFARDRSYPDILAEMTRSVSQLSLPESPVKVIAEIF
ncbi:uncharacterized protein LOC121366255 [Gigantopelta aegis]|uniref:uncharacterized protein LOC121366255 n=1 Tax=Gigantopelta aegis TaxID=1735272 RepID=UPI001B88941F|nr:uncharacterized protein LOC121366255 [Gigantopelta aegis]